MEQSKVCAKCKRDLSCAQFGQDGTRRDGLFPYCIECRREAVRVSQAKYREKYRQRERERYRRDVVRREDCKKRARARYAANPEAVKAYVKVWQEANAERVAKIKLESSRRRYARNPEPIREIWRRRHARKLGASIAAFTTQQLQDKVRYWGHRCWVCGAVYQAIDHVKPLNKGGLHVLANLRPICTACNTRKKDKWPYLKEAECQRHSR